MAEYVELIRLAGLDVLEVGPPASFLDGAKGEPPAKPFEPVGIVIRARKAGGTE